MTHVEQRAIERALMEVLMKTLRPAMDGIVATFRRELTKALQSIAAHGPAQRKGQLGRPKSCAVCKLKGARNHAGLPAAHTQEEHRRWKSGGGGGHNVARLPRRREASAGASETVGRVGRVVAS
jgi:hypothetical protein